MKYHTLPILGFIAGLVFIVSNYLRYGVIYSDVSEMIRGVLEGVFICAFAYVYNWMKNKDKEDFDRKMEPVMKVYEEQEFKR